MARIGSPVSPGLAPFGMVWVMYAGAGVIFAIQWWLGKTGTLAKWRNQE